MASRCRFGTPSADAEARRRDWPACKLADGHQRRAFSRASTQAFLRYQVLLFPPQDVPPARQVAFARRFGEVQIHVMNQYHADGYPELYRLSNLDEHGKPNGKHPDKGTLAWHTDGSWSRVTGQATIIYGEVVPEVGGETHFCDMYGAYERLEPGMEGAHRQPARRAQPRLSRARAATAKIR